MHAHTHKYTRAHVHMYTQTHTHTHKQSLAINAHAVNHKNHHGKLYQKLCQCMHGNEGEREEGEGGRWENGDGKRERVLEVGKKIIDVLDSN